MHLIFFSFGFVCVARHVSAGFVFSAPHSQHIESLRGRERQYGKDMGGKLQTKVLPSGITKSHEQVEPAAAEHTENEEEKESRGELLAAASFFNAASSQNDKEQQAMETALRDAMATPAHLGIPTRQPSSSTPVACVPDFTKCPRNWNQKGVLCFAKADYEGGCSSEADLSEMSAEQKIAFANACAVEFPCQEDCKQDFRQRCPSLWREVGAGVCAAPLEYEGGCSTRFDVSSMSDEDKYAFGIRCGARWPCAKVPKHNYADICPQGWSLQFGKLCTAPVSYDGPCEPTAYMFNVAMSDKKMFEATCRVEWPKMGAECTPDYSASCPFGWLDSVACVAPPAYKRCGRSHVFENMSPAEKADWASTCQVAFPCRDRMTCEKIYAAPCPANWYAFNGGMSCAAPKNYVGACSPVLHGMADLRTSEKIELESKCQFSWPCYGEVYESILYTDLGEFFGCSSSS